MVLTMATASTFIGSSVTAALTMHIPIRGRSLRDRIRPRPQTHHRGWRLTPGTHSSLTSTELIALVDDTPTPIRALTCHNVEYQLDGKIGHHYARYEQRFGIQREHWSHLCVEADRHSDLEALASFLQHRLHLLGLRARPLGQAEIDYSLAHPPQVELRHYGSAELRYTATHLWHTRERIFDISPGPAQMLGIGSKGQAITMNLTTIPKLRIDLGGNDGTDLLLPALLLGYRIGIRTSRPRHFHTPLAHGAELITHAGNPELDVVLLDAPGTAAHTHYARVIDIVPPNHDSARTEVHTPVQLYDTIDPEENPTGADHYIPQLEMGELTWRLRTARTHQLLRPLDILRPTRTSSEHTSHTRKQSVAEDEPATETKPVAYRRRVARPAHLPTGPHSRGVAKRD